MINNVTYINQAKYFFSGSLIGYLFGLYKHKNRFQLLVFVLFFLQCKSQSNESVQLFEQPSTPNPKSIIQHKAYSLHYNEKHEQADWVAYELTKEETNKTFGRTDKFISDPLVATGSASDDDYKGSGFDRGHLAPAADMGWSAETMSESFYYSNMSPQVQNFNRGIWKKLEELVRTWAIENNAVYVVTGPVLRDGLPTIGLNKVSVPEYYYKVVLDYSLPDKKAIALLLPNEASKKPLQSFVISIDKLEEITGLNFFPLLDSVDERKMERMVCLSCWSWETIELNYPPSKEIKESPYQCKGKTRSGSRCVNITKNASGYCEHHDPLRPRKSEVFSSDNKDEISDGEQQENIQELEKPVRCSERTKSGKRCSRTTKKLNGKCFQHQ